MQNTQNISICLKRRPLMKYNADMNLDDNIEDNVRYFISYELNKFKGNKKKQLKKKTRRRVKIDKKIASFVFPRSREEKRLRLIYLKKIHRKKLKIRKCLKKLRERLKEHEYFISKFIGKEDEEKNIEKMKEENISSEDMDNNE
ncbi:conserved Plasmodium protein, unknown function [Plasmodium sp. DRC-Itaito]|uniref:Uncharacterized protein n=1 Tax=Plasmodium gaboni TaxID=647221 RepID=A0ABY1UUW4_9APIC|nr:conserved Plasmodium protein, unknown function [Plasmodium gaboni]SOV25422.1 conserved Plasmodium protein, unknown function [Plasmodium sp. DRC-Itaito]